MSIWDSFPVVPCGSAPLQLPDPPSQISCTIPTLILTATGGRPPYRWSTTLGRIEPIAYNQAKLFVSSTGSGVSPTIVAFYQRALARDAVFCNGNTGCSQVAYSCFGTIIESADCGFGSTDDSALCCAGEEEGGIESAKIAAANALGCVGGFVFVCDESNLGACGNEGTPTCDDLPTTVGEGNTVINALTHNPPDNLGTLQYGYGTICDVRSQELKDSGCIICILDIGETLIVTVTDADGNSVAIPIEIIA